MAKKTASISNSIIITGARVHNLKNVSLRIPKNKLVVITGLSGSGKSSLAFDTVYAEAERRFIESLSSYARQFLGVKDKPDVDSIEGLSPAIAIDQKSVAKNPRSTVGTITEIYDYLRILFARVGIPHCPSCKRPVTHQSAEQITKQILRLPSRAEVMILAPVIRGKKGEHQHVLKEIQFSGFLRVRLNGEVMRLEEALSKKLDKQKKQSIDVVVDRFTKASAIDRTRVFDSVETALKIGKGFLIVSDGAKETLFSEQFACTHCDISIPTIEPRIFSFNSPYGACLHCTGLGATLEVDENLVFPNKNLTLAEGAIRPWASASHRVGRQSWFYWLLADVAERHAFSLNVPVRELPKKALNIILYGEKGAPPISDEEMLVPTAPTLQSGQAASGEGNEHPEHGAFEGVVNNLKRRWKETDSEWTRSEIEKYMIVKICPVCNGARLKQEALAVTIDGHNTSVGASKNIAEISALSVEELKKYFKDFLKRQKSKSAVTIASPLVKEIIKRLSFLKDVGLEYMTLSRESTTLSGGEAQRIRLATQIGSRLTGVLYILDEPSKGLHPRDHYRLIETLKRLRDIGNTVIVVEHDRETMREADWIIDLGPGAGKHGGHIVYEGTPRDIMRAPTLTGEYLSGEKSVSIGAAKKTKEKKEIRIVGAAHNNLKHIDVSLPLEKFVVVTGVSGSGKSSLINDILARQLLVRFYNAHLLPGVHKKITGAEHIDKVIIVDQSPIGRTPRSNPATYTGAFTIIRELFAKTNEARARGYGPGRFSFNVKGGRCESCEGQGVKKIEMFFLPDVYVECEECGGKRYNAEALSVEYSGKNIHEILQLSIEEAFLFFKHIPKLKEKLETLMNVGLGYVALGQSAPTLSGGEAQRIKLAAELSRRDTGKTLYILDEPTTGLHFDDMQKLLQVLRALVDKQNSVIVIEHNLDVIQNADWIVDLGPESGEKGGEVVAEGTPEDIMKAKRSYTGQWLQRSSRDNLLKNSVM